MATELQIAQGYQTLFLAMSEFSSGDVVINDDSIYDGSNTRCPYAIIYTSIDFEIRQASARSNSTITLPVMHVEKFTTYKESYDNLRNTRQAMWDEVFTGVGMSANGLAGVSVVAIRNLSDILDVTYAESDGKTFPVYIQQLYGIELELF